MSKFKGQKSNVAQTYDVIAESVGSEFGSVSERTDKIEKFLTGLPSPMTILDVGPGKGYESRIAVDLGHRLIGLDVSPKMQEIYQQTVPEAQVLLGSMTDIPLSEKSVDVVLSSCSLLHLDQTQGKLALAEFFRVLKPEGKLYLVTSLGRGEEEVHQREGEECIGVDSWYFFHWCPKDLRKTLEDENFVVESWQEEEIVKNRPLCAFIACARR